MESHDGVESRAVMALITDVVRNELPRLIGDAHEDERKALIREIGAAQSAAANAGILALAATKRGISVPGADLDADRWLVNTPTGTVNLRTGTVEPHRPADFLTKVTTAGFRPETRSDLFDDFLSEVQPDPQMRAFLARSLGSGLLGLVREHVLLIWHGTGANGKGTLRDAVRHALGGYAVEVPADILMVNKYGQQALAPERMRLRGTRLAFCSEITQGARLDEATMKKLTGGDPVNAKLLYRNPVEFDPSHTLFMLTNHLPRVRGDDPAMWRRILAVPWDVVIPESARDPELGERLEHAADAVLAWLWGGWQDYQRQGLAPPEAVRAATTRYQQESDIVARFLGEDADQVIVGHGTTRSAELYRRFASWCRAEGEHVALSNKAFTEQVELHGFKRKRGSSGIVWQELTLTVESDEPDTRKWYE